MSFNDRSYGVRIGFWEDDDMTSAYWIENFPVQSDQGHFKWLNPVTPSGAPLEYEELFEAIDRSKGGEGGFEVSWIFPPLTPLMIQYLRQTIFNGALWADVTIITWDSQFGWRVIQCRAQWNEPAKVAKSKGRKGYDGIKIDFVSGVDVTEEP